MKRILFAVLFILFASHVEASPFLICDPYLTTEVQPTEFRITYKGGSGSITVISPAVKLPDGSVYLHWDLASLSPGTYELSVLAAKIDPDWGETVSTAVPFTLVKPVVGIPKVPANIKLLK